MKKNSGKRDLSEAAIVNALTKAGCDIDYAERKPWDITVGRAGLTYLIEIKDKKGDLTESQKDFLLSWRGHYAVVRSPVEALKAVGLGV
jgi:hypothetical protein